MTEFLAILLIAVFAIFLLGLARPILAHIQGIKQVVHHVAETPLIGQYAFEAIKTAAGPVFDQRPPQVDNFACSRRRRFAGKPLAHDHGDGILDRRIGTVGDLIVFAAMKTIIEHGGEILLNTAHAPRSDRFDAGLLDCFEHRARLLSAGDELAMHRRVVTGEPQRDRVGMAAHDGRFPLVEPA